MQTYNQLFSLAVSALLTLYPSNTLCANIEISSNTPACPTFGWKTYSSARSSIKPIGKLTLSKVKLLICSLSRPVADSDRLFTTS